MLTNKRQTITIARFDMSAFRTPLACIFRFNKNSINASFKCFIEIAVKLPTSVVEI